MPCCRPVVQKDPLAVQQNAVGQVFDLLDEPGRAAAVPAQQGGDAAAILVRPKDELQFYHGDHLK